MFGRERVEKRSGRSGFTVSLVTASATFGLFLLVINALMLLLVARLVSGFRVDGFGTAFWASIFISLLSWVLGAFVLGGSPEYTIPTSPGPGQVWL